MLISRRKKGMTLFEILVAIALFSLIITLVASSFITGVKNTKEGKTNVDFQAKARQTLDIIATEVREAYKINTNPALESASGTNTITFIKQDPFKGGEQIKIEPFTDSDGTIKIRRIEQSMSGTPQSIIGQNLASLNDLTFKAYRYSSYAGYESIDTGYKSISISLKTTDPSGQADPYDIATVADQRAMPGSTDVSWLDGQYGSIAPGSTEDNPARIPEIVKVGF